MIENHCMIYNIVYYILTYNRSSTPINPKNKVERKDLKKVPEAKQGINNNNNK